MKVPHRHVKIAGSCKETFRHNLSMQDDIWVERMYDSMHTNHNDWIIEKEYVRVVGILCFILLVSACIHLLISLISPFEAGTDWVRDRPCIDAST
jgi:hypothetical protein